MSKRKISPQLRWNRKNKTFLHQKYLLRRFKLHQYDKLKKECYDEDYKLFKEKKLNEKLEAKQKRLKGIIDCLAGFNNTKKPNEPNNQPNNQPNNH